MNDLDDMLARLSAIPTPRALEHIDEQVIGRFRALSMHREPSVVALGGGTAAIALLLGVVVSGAVTERNEPPSRELAALTMPTPYAPSTLLGQ